MGEYRQLVRSYKERKTASHLFLLMWWRLWIALARASELTMDGRQAILKGGKWNWPKQKIQDFRDGMGSRIYGDLII